MGDVNVFKTASSSTPQVPLPEIQPNSFLLAQTTAAPSEGGCNDDQNSIPRVRQRFESKFSKEGLDSFNSQVEILRNVYKAGEVPTSTIVSLAYVMKDFAEALLSHMTSERSQCGDCQDCHNEKKVFFEEYLQTASAVKVLANEILERAPRPDAQPITNSAGEALFLGASTIAAIIILKKIVGAGLLLTPAAPLGGALILTP